VHAALVTVALLQGAGAGDRTLSQPLVASLAPSTSGSVLVATMGVSVPAGISLPAPLPLADLMPSLASTAPAHVTLEPFPAAAPGPATNVDGVLLADRSRLGEYLGRQLAEFPREIDYAAKAAGPISAPYPAAAIAEGTQGSVAIWAVIGETGEPEEVVAVDGPDVLAQAAVAAVRRASFRAAHNNMKPIRYPIALEFRFALSGAPAAMVASGTN
jgi:TonB family protein